MRFQFTANITPEEARLLDRILKTAGFENCTGYLTALIYATLYGRDADTHPPPGNVADWIGSVRDRAADHDRLLDAAFVVFDEIAFATITMKGTGYVLAHIGSDLEAAIYECCGLLSAAEDLRTYLRVYQNVRRPQLMQYPPNRWQTSTAGSAAAKMKTAKTAQAEDDRRSRASSRRLHRYNALI